VWTPAVSQQYSLPIWGAHGMLWSMCLVSTPIAKRIRLPMVSHVDSLFFSSVFCVLKCFLSAMTPAATPGFQSKSVS
jgi:hypothetical protein